jgi:hypothetical protein
MYAQEYPVRRFFTMSSQTLYRWSGIILLVGGLLGLVGSILDTVLYPSGHNQTAQQILSTPFIIDASLFLAWALLLALDLPGLYLRQAARAGALGFAGFVLVLLGVLLGGVAFATIQVAVFPYLAQLLPKALGPGGQAPVAVLLLVIIGPGLLLAIGAILLGIATMRARVFPRWTGILLIVGGVLFLLSIPPIPSPFSDIISLAGNVALFVAFGWFGYAFVAGGKEPVAAAELSAPAAQTGR